MPNSIKLNLSSLKKTKPTQLIQFAAVGIMATATQFFLVLLLVETIHFQPLLANIIAFLFAFQVSFYGHRKWTFDNTNPQSTTIYRYLTVTIFCFFLNETLYALLLHVCKIHYLPALFIVLMIIPPLTFILSKLWAFKA